MKVFLYSSLRGVYEVYATAFDIRHFSESTLTVTVFKMDCTTPRVSIPNSFTDLTKPEMAPKKIRSEAGEIQTISELVCTNPVIT